MHSAPLLLRSAMAVSLLSILCRLAGAAREVLVAARLGVSAETDSFVLAFLFLSVYVNVLSASVGIAFLPQFVRNCSTEDPGSAHALYSRCTVAAVAIGLAGTSAFLLAGERMMRAMTGQTDQAFLELCTFNLKLLAPLAFTTPLVSLWTAVLSARGYPLLPVASPLLTTLVTTVFLWPQPPNTPGGGSLLAAGVLTGGVLEAIVLASALHRSGFSLWPARLSPHPLERIAGREFLFLALSALTSGAVAIVANSLAARLGSGSAAALGYAARIPSLLTPVGVTLMSAVFLPHFSRLASAGNWEKLRYSFGRCTALSFAASLPLTAVLLFASEPLVKLLYERGTFSSADTSLVRRLQMLYLLQIPFILPGLLGTRVLMTLGQNRLLLAVTAGSAIFSVTACLLLAGMLGLSGISLSASLAQAVSGSAACLLAWRRLLRKDRPPSPISETTSSVGALSALKEAKVS